MNRFQQETVEYISRNIETIWWPLTIFDYFISFHFIFIYLFILYTEIPKVIRLSTINRHIRSMCACLRSLYKTTNIKISLLNENSDDNSDNNLLFRNTEPKCTYETAYWEFSYVNTNWNRCSGLVFFFFSFVFNSNWKPSKIIIIHKIHITNILVRRNF